MGWFLTSPIQLCGYTQIVEEDLALYHMYILADWGHMPLIVSAWTQATTNNGGHRVMTWLPIRCW